MITSSTVTAEGRSAWQRDSRQWPRPMWWPASNPINAPVPANPVLDPQSAAIVTALAAGSGVVNVIEYGVPIYVATPTTPRWTIVPARSNEAGGDYGPNPFADIQVPLDLSWRAQAVAADGALVAIDGDRHYDFYNLDLSGAAPVCDWGGLSDPRSTSATSYLGGATATNFSRAAGVVRLDEWARGRIDHALVFSTDIARPVEFRFPATKTDGANLRGSATTIIEGTRIQLNPSYDVDGDANLRPYERIIAKALQTYGAFCIDNGGAALGISAERPHGAVMPNRVNSSIYAAVGITKDYASLTNIPLSQLRVLNAWDGS